MPYSPLEAKAIEQLCKVVDCEHKTAPYVDESEYHVVRTSNVRNGQLLMEDMKYTTFDGFNEWTARAVPEYGDVLFTREAPAGESCLVPKNKKLCMGQRMVMLRADKSQVDPLFLSMILNKERTKADILRLSIGTTVSRINIADIKKLKIASPPLPEQRKIASILGTWDKAISTTERLIDNSKQQKKALMQQLLTDAHKGKRLLDDSGKPFDGEVQHFKLGDISKMNSGGTPKSSIDEYYGGEIPWVSIADMTKHGKWISSTVKHLTKAGIENSSARLYPTGTVLYAMYASIGECSISTVELASSQAILGIRPSSRLSNIYLYYFLSHLKEKITLMGQQGTQSNLNAGMVKDFRILLPSLLEQQKIAAVLTNADQEIELLKQQLADLKQEKKALMQQLLTGKRRVLI